MRNISMIIAVFLYSLSFGLIVATPASASVETGEILKILLKLTDENGKPISGTVSADFEAGGFEELDIIYGMDIDGESTVHYIAPLDPGDYSVKFISDDSTAEVYVKVFQTETVGEEATAQVVDFRGSVALKRRGSEVWKPIEKGQIVMEGDSILALGRSYAILRFPNDSETRVMENTQLEVVELKKVEGGYSIVLRQHSGKTFSIVKKLLRAGERFFIETKSVTAGVRGTKFAIIEEKDGFEVETFEGKVFAYLEDGRAFLVPAGKGLKPDGRMVRATHAEEEFEPWGEEEEKHGEERGEKERMKSPPIGFKSTPPSVFLGTVSTEKENYLVYSFGIGFELGPVGLDLGLTAYSTEIGGDLYYGLPSENPSTNVIDAFTINAVKLGLGPLRFRYGSGGIYTLGMGYAFKRYSTGFSRTLDVGFSTDDFRISLHIPYELRKISSLEFVESDSIYFGEVSVRVMEFYPSLAIVYDSSPTALSGNEPVDYSLIASIKKEIFGFMKLGAELSLLHGLRNDVAFGVFAGLSGEMLMFDLLAGPYLNIGGFTPGVYSSNCIKGISKDRGLKSGYTIGVEFSESWGEGRLHLSGDFWEYPSLEGYLKAILPKLGSFPSVELSGYVYDPEPFEGILDEDTTAWLTVAAVAGGALKVGTKFHWNGSEWKTSVFVTSGVSM